MKRPIHSPGAVASSDASLAKIQELTADQLVEVHGGELKIEMPQYIPLSQSHPKTETTLPRVPYH
jgi:hypothetical protein